jgi:hypothetical protein
MNSLAVVSRTVNVSPQVLCANYNFYQILNKVGLCHKRIQQSTLHNLTRDCIPSMSVGIMGQLQRLYELPKDCDITVMYIRETAIKNEMACFHMLSI